MRSRRVPSPVLWLLLGSFATSVAALSALDRPRSGFLQDVLESKAVDQKYCKPSGLIDDACCDFETVESVNDELYNALHEIVSTPYFRYHKVDLYRECPFWQEDGSCMNRACGVETTEEQTIPEKWRPSKLGELNLNKSSSSSPEGASLIRESDFCVLEDELDSGGVYVDLLENPERFTGYAGHSSSRVWKAIYEENCFTPVQFIDPARPESDGGSGYAPLSNPFGAMSNLPSLVTGGHGWGESEKKLFGSLAGPRDGGDETCLEKRVFYRVISGLHASISIHICDDYLDKATGIWSPNLQCFVTRIAQHPERLQNVYFTYVLLLRALSKSGPLLLNTLNATGAESSTVNRLRALHKVAGGCPTTFDEGSMFTGPGAEILKDEFKSHFRNVSRIMDCVGCDKCRLWGKLQVTGLGTALKLLFSSQEPTSPTSTSTLTAVQLSRSEVVAFVNTLHRLSESLAAVERFRGLWNERSLEERGRVEKRAEEGVQEEEVREEVEVESQEEEVEVERVERELDGREQVRIEHEEELKVGSTKGGNNSTMSTTPPLIIVKECLERVVDLCKDGWRNCVDLVIAWSGNGAETAKSEL